MSMIGKGLAVFVAAVALASLASAQTVTVTTTADVVDIDGFNGTLADLPGPDGLVSLSEAMIATNNTPGHQTVAFAIPESELGWGFLYPGQAVFHALTGFYWRANDEVTIDGTTQTAFAGDTNPDGHEVLLYGNTFYLNDDNSTLRGFDSTSIQVSGSSSLIEDNTGSMNITVFGGSGSTIRNNECGTIKLDRSNDNLVVGNTTQRVRVLGGGTSAPISGTVIGGPDPEDRNFITGYGAWNSEGLPAGAAIQLAWNLDTVIENNWIGTTPDGLAQGNLACTMGISFETDNNDVVVRDNRIAGILGLGMGPHHAGQLFGWAIYFWGSTTNIEIVGNTIGLDANDEPSLGSVWGVNVDNFSFYTVDGVSLIDNMIAGHILNGVRVGPTAEMRISRTMIYANGWLGIDLIGDDFASGVTPNDPLDADTGGSCLQNYPELAVATSDGVTTAVSGSLASSPSDSFTLEFFASPELDPSGFGQGQVFLGSSAVVTGVDGTASFAATLPTATPDGWFVTATATLEPLGATSEFSAGIAIGGLSCQADLGFQGPGTGQLSVCGEPLTSGATADLAVVAVPGLAPVWVAFGIVNDPTPILAGTLVPFPPALIWPLAADSTGEAHLAIPGGASAPHFVYAQAAYLDATLHGLVGFTNAVAIELLP